jgi:hypothetical protein
MLVMMSFWDRIRTRMGIFFFWSSLFFFENTVARFIAAVDGRVVNVAIVVTIIIIIIIIIYLVFTNFLTLEDRTDRLSRNVGKKLSLLAA